MKIEIIGLTGGIGSGKTTIARFFAEQGVPVYIADEEAKKILYQPQAMQEVKAAFGEAVFTDGQPDRRKIADAVFGNPDKLKTLNQIIHPKVAEHFKHWVHNNSHKGFVIKEAAILFESGSYKDCDKVILVTAPKEVRIKRVMQRDGVTQEKVVERMKAQWDDDKKRQLSDYVIENVDLDHAIQKASEILKELENHKK